MNRVRNQLIVVFLAATLVPLGATLWITVSLLEHSLSYSSTRQLDETSQLLRKTGREYYQRARDELKKDANAGHLSPQHFRSEMKQRWPEPVRDFWASGEAERYNLSGAGGNRLEYLLRRGDEIQIYSTPLGIGMEDLSRQYRQARDLVETGSTRDLRRGFLYTYGLLASGIWLVSLAALVFLAHRISRPIQHLTAGLSELAAGNPEARVERTDEIGRAMRAFNHMAEQLQRNRERLVYLAQMASWQNLARKMAHELKNSLTPIRLTMEEVLARRGESNGSFLEQVAQIVIDEVETLERRLRAFSELSAEPPVQPVTVDLNGLLEERIAFLRNAHPEVMYQIQLAEPRPRALADHDLLKGIFTNLLENAAQAAGKGGAVFGLTFASSGRVGVEIHDSGPGVSDQARQSLFQPTISFKKGGMGVGLSIARKGALLSGGDIQLIKGELGGAAFRVLLPAAAVNGH